MPTARTTRRPASSRPVPELLLELAYYLHATRAVALRPAPPHTPKSEPVRPGARVRPPAPPCLTAS